MDRYDKIDLDLECDGGGGVAQKAALFGGMFKKSSKSAEPPVQAQDNISTSSELSKSNDSLTDINSTKDIGGVIKGMFKKPAKSAKEGQQQATISIQSPDVSASSDNLTENNKSLKDKSGVLGGILKRSPKPRHARRPSQDLLENELTASNDSLSENANTKEKGGITGLFKKSPKPFGSRSQSQDDLSAPNEKSGSTDNLSVNHNTKETGGIFSGMFRKSPKPFGARSQSQDDLSEPSELSGSTDNLSESSNTKKDTEETETLKETEKQVEEKPKLVKSNMIHRERKERSDSPLVPARLTEEETNGTCDKVKTRGTEDIKKKEKPAETPAEEQNRAARHGLKKEKNNRQNQSDDEGLKEDESAEGGEGDKVNPPESKTTKVKKHKHHNPFMSRVAVQAASDDEGLKDDDESKEEKKDEDGNDKPEETKVKKPKRHNPFLPRVKVKVVQKNVQDGAPGNTAENEAGNRTLFDQLEDFRIDSKSEGSQEVEDLMDWWNTVEGWEETPQNDDMTEKEEAKAFAVTADKVQKGIRVFNKLFSERAESLWQHVIDLNSMADALDKFNKNTKIAQITGGSTSAIGGVATIAGLALAPITFGTSLIVTAVGLGVATAGGLTSAGAGISNQVNNSMDRKKVEKIVEDYQEKMVDLNKCLKFIKQGIENLRRFDLIKMKNHAYNRDFPVLSSSFYEDGAMAGKAILINANEIMRVVQIANVAGSTAARAVQIASMATGVLTGLFVGMDIYFVAKDSKELKKGAKSEFAGKIREVATQLHDGLVELNSLREELQDTSRPQDDAEDEKAPVVSERKKEDENQDSSEDEIDRIKKAIKKDYENREYV
ncbi:nucleolar protein dao-5-like isoform X3 [Scomber scombrus]|uniref:Nucleolar protein dao-5-like isoform X3 n=1 Tax=Scomber scombrus TaxID=13677 RepID=A0AAV1PU09_SCOSC